MGDDRIQVNAERPLHRLPTQHNSFEVDPTFPQFDFNNLGDIETGGRPIRLPELAYFGPDHAMNTARLAVVILSREFPDHDTERNQRILWSAGTFHDLAREAPWQAEDPNHAKRAAELTSRILGKYNLGEIRDDVCRLIARHHDDPDGPLAACLSDADAYEACRVAPGTKAGLEYLSKRCATLSTRWARERKNLRRYMESRGW